MLTKRSETMQILQAQIFRAGHSAKRLVKPEASAALRAIWESHNTVVLLAGTRGKGPGEIPNWPVHVNSVGHIREDQLPGGCRRIHGAACNPSLLSQDNQVRSGADV